MKTPKAPKESKEQKAERQRAKESQARAIQSNVADRTSTFARLVNPGVSLVTGSVRSASVPLAGRTVGPVLRNFHAGMNNLRQEIFGTSVLRPGARRIK